MKILAIVMLVIAGLAGLVAYRISVEYARTPQPLPEASEQEEVAPTTLVVVALQPLAANVQIRRDDVALTPVTIAPAHYFANVDDVVGRVPLVDIDAGAPVTPRYFRDANVLARIIPAGSKAMSLQIDEVVAVGGFVRPGDTVDVLVFLRGSGTQDAQARYLLRSALVLGYEERVIDRPEGVDESSSTRRQRIRTAVVAVPEADVTRVMLGANLGELRLALHGQGTTEEDGGQTTGLPLAPDAVKAVSDQAADVITREELIGIDKKTPATERRVRPPVYVYRANELESVRP
ncbi:MAG: Flp pilus assembly protein CpaB [Nevskiales bacterium]|nr:Flp pilus assembly protein CpaB [Nevskiales bacterium]